MRRIFLSRTRLIASECAADVARFSLAVASEVAIGAAIGFGASLLYAGRMRRAVCSMTMSAFAEAFQRRT